MKLPIFETVLGGLSVPGSIVGTRRTLLASERTQLAWWRTGPTALAVALAVGRIYGVAVLLYGSVRRGAIERALAAGRFPSPPRLAHTALAAGGVLLGLLTVVLILLD